MNPLRRLLQSTALAGLLALGATAAAQTQGYASKTRSIRAAVLLLDEDKPVGTTPLTGGGPYRYGQTGAPYAFFNLDRAADVKPGGWVFVNPSAPGALTRETRERFREVGMADADIPPAGTPINKQSAAYWTVPLSGLSDTQISNYDVLLLAPRYKLSLNAYERERLRRFVDGGGTLWVDLLGANALQDENNLPFALLRTTGGSGNAYRDVSSPVLDGPRRLTGGDLNFINDYTTFGLAQVPSGFGNNNTPLTAEFGRYRTVAAVGGVPVISEARLGDGSIVVTARGAAQLLGQGAAQFPVGTAATSNVAYYAANPTLGPAGRSAARLAVNIVSLSGGFRQAAGGSRKAGSAAQDPGSPVLARFTMEGTAPYGPADAVKKGVPVGPPVTYKGFLVASIRDEASNNYRVVVLDAVPGRDLDGDGDEDDGIVNGAGQVLDIFRDSSLGKPLDVVWVSAPLANAISSPVCAEVPETPGVANNPGVYVDQILVTDVRGTLHTYQLAPRSGVAGGFIGGQHGELALGGDPNGIDPPEDASSFPGGTINPPTVYDGLAYMADSVSDGGSFKGRVWVVDLSTGLKRKLPDTPLMPKNYWFVGGRNMAAVPYPAFTSSPTVGYIPIQDNTGGLDRVLYAPGVVNMGTPSAQPGFVSLWLGAKGEKPRVNSDGVVLTITTRAGTNSQLPIYFPDGGDSAVMKQLSPHLSITDPNGNPLDVNNYVRSGPKSSATLGEIIFDARVGQAEFDKVNVRIDYSIDWSFDPKNLGGQIQRGRLLLPIRKIPTVDPSQRILGPIALTSRGTLHMVQGSSTGAAGGTYWAMREDANRGSFRTVSRYTLYKSYNQSFGASGQAFPVPQVLQDEDGVQTQFPAFIKNDANFRVFTNFRYAGGVALRNGVAYAAINAQRSSLNIPVTMVAAFRAEPETPELRLGNGLGVNPKLAQADFARSDPAALVRSPVTSTLATNNLTVDVDNGIIRLENLATVLNGEITDCISLSQPVGVGSDGRAFVLRYPEANGDRWSPLLWFGLWNGATATGAPLVAGNEVFLAANTILLGALGLSGGDATTVGGLGSNGVVWSIDADAPTSGNYAVPLPNRPWIVQQAQLLVPNPADPSTVSASPYYRMPQNRGLRDFDDFKLRLLQTKMGTSTVAYGVAGGEGTVAAWGDRGVYGMSRADFVVCDEGRLLRIDSAGNPVQNSFGARFSGVGGGGGVAEMRPLVRPVKAYPIGTNEYLVVDAGANRVVRLDDDGAELRSIDRITLDPNFKPDAYRVNEPLTLKDPRDAATYEGYVTKGAQEVVTNQGTYEYWVRYIIADSGNGRLIELADRYKVDANTGAVGDPVSILQKDPETGVDVNVPQVGVLVWQSPSLEQTTVVGDYYNSVSRVFIGDIGGTNAGRYVYVAGVGRTRPTRSSAGLDNPNSGNSPLPSGAAGGAVVLFDPQGGTRVFDRFKTPDLRATRFYNAAAGANDLLTGASRPPQTNRPFLGISAVTARPYVQGGVSSIRVMVSDVDAVYEFTIGSSVLADAKQDPTGNGTIEPSWMMNEAAFTTLRRGAPDNLNARSFRPVYARRLDSGDVVVVNGFRGLTKDGKSTYSGEVALLDGNVDYSYLKDNLGFSLSSLHFELPPLTGIRGLLSPVFADRR